MRSEVNAIWCQVRQSRTPLGVCLHAGCDRRDQCEEFRSISIADQVAAAEDVRTHGHDIAALQIPLLEV